MSIKFTGTGVHRVKKNNNNNDFHILETMGDFGKDIPVYFPDRLSKPARDQYVQVSGKITLNKNQFIMLVAEHWEDVQTGDECRYSATKQGENQDSGGNPPPLRA